MFSQVVQSVCSSGAKCPRRNYVACLRICGQSIGVGQTSTRGRAGAVFRPRYPQIAPGGRGRGGGCPAQIYPNRADAGRSYTPVCFIAYFTRPTQISISIRIGGVLHVQNSVLLIIDSFDAFGGSGCSDFSRDFFCWVVL